MIYVIIIYYFKGAERLLKTKDLYENIDDNMESPEALHSIMEPEQLHS